VHLMTEMLKPQPSESIYDPTCGSGGMLLSCITHLRRQGQEWRNVRLYGQERNLMTSSIARMNCFLHGIEDFQIVRGDTLSEPKFVKGDRLMRFDVVLANPPYSIKQWDRTSFGSDQWGRNLYGIPPQGRADYAFWQHILCSLAPEAGRCAILFPHGVLFREEEAGMRRRIIEADVVECVIGLGPNLFYNSPMEACIVICRAAKPKPRKNKILLVNAVNEVTRERAQSFLTDDHIERVVKTYERFKDESGFAHVASLDEIRQNDFSLSIPLYVEPAAVQGKDGVEESLSLKRALDGWLKSKEEVVSALTQVVPEMKLPKIGPGLRSTNSCHLLSERSNWVRVRFGDVVDNLNETESNPGEAGLERFIGLEHLEPGSLHVRSWGNVANGTTFTRRCRPGQVLFGKRRAYQRKVAVADFDALVSGDIYVLAPKGDQLLPELLPFICLSERFFEHAIGTSAGSLSPRTNWSSLGQFEFSLPPLDLQRRLAEVAWAVASALRQSDGFLEDITESKSAFQSGWLTRNGIRVGWNETTLSDVTKRISVGLACSTTEYYRPEGVPLIRNQNIRPLFLDDRDMLFLDPGFASKFEKKKLKARDVITTRTGANIGQTCLVPEMYAGAHSFTTVIITCDEDRLVPEYLVQHMNAPVGVCEIQRLSTSGGKGNLNVTQLSGYRIDLPSLAEQHEIVTNLDAIDQSQNKLLRLNDSLRALLKVIIDTLVH
jgi:restriction endonuclease S subunit